MRTLWQRPEPSAGPPSNPAEIADRALHRRAIEAVIWGMPAVNFELMRRQMVKPAESANQVVFWSRPVGWKNQTLTQPRHHLLHAVLRHQGRRPSGDGDTACRHRRDRRLDRRLLADRDRRRRARRRRQGRGRQVPDPAARP